jgi:hypothetical protein
MAASQCKGHCVPVLSTLVRNNIARIMDKVDDAFSDCEETVNCVAKFFYKPVGPFTTDVSVEEVKPVVSVSELGLRWVTAKGSDEDPTAEQIPSESGYCHLFLPIWQLPSTNPSFLRYRKTQVVQKNKVVAVDCIHFPSV